MDAHPTPSEQPLKGPARLVRRAGERLAGVEHPAFHGLPEHVTVEGRRRLPEHLELGTASFTIAYIEIMDGSFAIEELPFAVGDLVTVTYEFDETFVPTPLPGTTSGLDYSGALSALSVVVQAATPTSVDFEQGISVFTASTFSSWAALSRSGPSRTSTSPRSRCAWRAVPSYAC